MARLLRAILVAALLAWPTSLTAQGPGQAPANPAAPPTALAAPEARNTSFDHIAAFAGMILLLLVVCYPSRRY